MSILGNNIETLLCIIQTLLSFVKTLYDLSV